jgi:hypothetical protein
MNDPADDATIILPLDTSHVSRQMRFDPLPLLVAQPKQIPAHDPNPSPKRISIVARLLSSGSPNLDDARVEPFAQRRSGCDDVSLLRHHPAQFANLDHDAPQRWRREFNELGPLTFF